jgi:hypothetical protein
MFSILLANSLFATATSGISVAICDCKGDLAKILILLAIGVDLAPAFSCGGVLDPNGDRSAIALVFKKSFSLLFTFKRNINIVPFRCFLEPRIGLMHYSSLPLGGFNKLR